MMLGKAHPISKQSIKLKQELKLQDQTNETATCTIQAKEIKRKVETEGLKQIKETRENKLLHGPYPQRI